MANAKKSQESEEPLPVRGARIIFKKHLCPGNIERILVKSEILFCMAVETRRLIDVLSEEDGISKMELDWVLKDGERLAVYEREGDNRYLNSRFEEAPVHLSIRLEERFFKRAYNLWAPIYRIFMR